MLGSFSPFLSCHENIETSASLCGSWMWRGGKKSNETVKPSSLILQHISVKWTLSSRQRLRTKAAQRKPSHSCCTEILEEEETSKGKCSTRVL